MCSWIRSETFVNQAIKLYEQKHLQDISEVIWVLKLQEKLVFGSAAWAHRHWTAENIITHRRTQSKVKSSLQMCINGII